jgi:hypothetical protein
VLHRRVSYLCHFWTAFGRHQAERFGRFAPAILLCKIGNFNLLYCEVLEVKKKLNGFEVIPPFVPDNFDDVQVTKMGNITRVKYMSSVNRRPTVRKVDKYSYIKPNEMLSPEDIEQLELPLDDVFTLVNAKGRVIGQYKKYRYNVESNEGNRTDNPKEIQRSFAKLRDIINANADRPERLRWCTFTYKENMMDANKLYRDFKNFNGRFKRWLVNNVPNNCNYEYITACEPQGRGAWHLHVLFIFDKTAPYIPNDDLYHIWGHGWVNIQALHKKKIDDIGRYLTAYLTDIPVDCDMPSAPDVKTVKGKRYIKGGRLHFYPTNFKFFRCSKGVKRPETTWELYGQVMEEVNPETLTSSSFFKVELPDFIDPKTEKPKVINFGIWLYNSAKKKPNPAFASAGVGSLGVPSNVVDVSNQYVPLESAELSPSPQCVGCPDWVNCSNMGQCFQSTGRLSKAVPDVPPQCVGCPEWVNCSNMGECFRSTG